MNSVGEEESGQLGLISIEIKEKKSEARTSHKHKYTFA